eukprot:jgi/Botrbrau1/17026/Bobra.49_2s0082.1
MQSGRRLWFPEDCTLCFPGLCRRLSVRPCEGHWANCLPPLLDAQPALPEILPGRVSLLECKCSGGVDPVVNMLLSAQRGGFFGAMLVGADVVAA